MDKEKYLKEKDIVSFIKWIEKYLDGKTNLNQHYEVNKIHQLFTFNSIYDAYQKYSWKFNYYNNNKKITGSNYEENEQALFNIKERLLNGLNFNDVDLFIDGCREILEWGGVKNKNYSRILNLDNPILYFKNVVQKLSGNLPYDKYQDIFINSGFTKIYSLLLEDFIIYDSRVGSALCMFVRMYCEENNLNKIPECLNFCWAPARSTKKTSLNKNKRCPNSLNYTFSVFNGNSSKHLECNIKANWLFSSILHNTESKFNLLNQNVQLRALESAFFMIGYQVNKN